jgi:phytoene/squalene synthetase
MSAQEAEAMFRAFDELEGLVHEPYGWMEDEKRQEKDEWQAEEECIPEEQTVTQDDKPEPDVDRGGGTDEEANPTMSDI